MLIYSVQQKSTRIGLTVEINNFCVGYVEMIRTIELKFGKAPGTEAEEIQATPVTVFVGPNNSGKSKVLSEIQRYCLSGQTSTTDVIVKRIEFETFSRDIAERRIQHVTLQPHYSETLQPNYIIVGKSSSRIQVPIESLISAFLNTNSQTNQFCQWYLQYNTLMLDGQNRIGLVNQQSAGDLLRPAQSSFQVLFRDDVKRKEVRRIIQDAFGASLVVDPTLLGQLRLRLSPRPPSNDLEERGIHDEAVKFHTSALPIEQLSDGVKAFTGMITEIIAGDPAVLLIDEPEAFLHPALSSKLGKEIATVTSGSEKRLFVSTHSPNFVMGCIQAGASVTIIRLTYRDGVATARILPKKDILRLMRNPLLRSTGVLSGLFYEFVVVTESDADRAFYQEVNERLLRFMPEMGVPNCLFINAQNKQTVQTIIRPLRELGIPVAGIVDIDVIKDGGTVWTSFLQSGYIPELEQGSLATLRAAIKLKFEESGKDMKRARGIELLQGSDREAANNLLDRLAEYGLFVVRKGELESWLPNLGATGHGPAWLVNVFEKMGEDPGIEGYVKPSQDDVWEFLSDIKKWLTNVNRKGIPA